MRVRDLGALAIESGGVERRVSGRLGSILALLAINANQRVSLDAVRDAVWEGGPPPGADSTLESHVWRLRRILEPDRAAGSAPQVLVSDNGGYRLVLTAEHLDSADLRRLRQAALDAMHDDDPALVVRLTEQAAALWRGRPFEPFTDRAWAEPAATRLVEHRAELAELRNAALLDLGRADAVLADLRHRLADDPYRERLWVQRMQALTLLGRTEEALRAYQDARSLLKDDLGITPGAELRATHQEILQQDETRPAGPSMPASPTPAGPAPLAASAGPGPDAEREVEVRLPSRTSPIVGREADLTALAGLLRQDALVTVVGPAGSGKTRLAVEAARGAARGNADGVWFVDLTVLDSGDVDAVAEVVASTIAFTSVPDRRPSHALREYVAGKDLLLLLDNCEHLLPAVADLVEDLLADTGSTEGGVRVLATSREALEVPGEVVWTVEPLPVPSPEDAAAGHGRADALSLFTARIASADPTFVLDARTRRVAASICAAVDGLPLAIELAAARIRAYSLDEIAEQVRADPNRLRGIGGAGRRRSLFAAMESSHQLMSSAEQVLHRRLSVLPGPFLAETAAAVAGNLPDRADARDVLVQLVNRSMLAPDRSQGRDGPTMYRQLFTVRAHAARELARAEEESAVWSLRRDWVVALVDARPTLGSGSDAAWFDRVERSYATVRAVLRETLERSFTPTGVRLAARLAPFWFVRQQLVEGVRWLRRATESDPGVGDAADRAVARVSLLLASSLQGGRIGVGPNVGSAVSDLRGVDPARMVDAGRHLGVLVRGVWARDDLPLVRAVTDVVREFAEVTGDPGLDRLRRALSCLVAVSAAPLDETQERGRQLHQDAVDQDDLLSAYLAGLACVVVAAQCDDWAAARVWSERLARLRGRLGDHDPVQYLTMRAVISAAEEDHRSAARLFGAAERQAVRSGASWPVYPRLTQPWLDAVTTRLTADELAAEWSVGRTLTESDVLAAP